MGRTIILLLAGLWLLALASTVAADDYAGLTADCVALCNAEDYEGAYKCFKNDRDPPSAYLAVATCAFNAYKDDVAEEYALKAAGSNLEWATFINRFGYTVMYTGGLGETYALAYVASGMTRHESKALQYLKTSRQCQKSAGPDLCAEQYLASKVAQYSQRNLAGSRVAYAKPTIETIYGRVTDNFGHPIKYAKVNYKCGATDNFAYTDETGSYRINFSRTGSVDRPTDVCTNGKLYVKLTYTDPKDGKVYFRI
ncbi:carboxypeptidase regulatory-like domain-containing protein, partial [Candidatus Woesearchaeota archaeon]|nr:carboxypeptidase regulatory-like domain-containing protein [Candidatus Woesearchaeota archaeon]